MKWMILMMLAFATFANAETPAEELTRLRRENAALKVENAKLKEELAALRPAMPKATRYTPEMIAKLIPADLMPGQNQKWDDTKREKAKKVIDARLAGEWISFDAPVAASPDAAMVETAELPAGNFRVRFLCKIDQSRKAIPNARGMVGKVRKVGLFQGDAPLIDIIMEDCQGVK